MPQPPSGRAAIYKCPVPGIFKSWFREGETSTDVTGNNPGNEALGKALKPAGFNTATPPGLWEGRVRIFNANKVQEEP